MARSAYNTIFLGSIAGTRPVVLEAIADEADIKPGMLVEYEAAQEIQKHATAGGVVKGPMIALESQVPNDDDAASIDIVYTADDTMWFAQARRGEVYNMLVAASQGALQKGINVLISNGDGTLKDETVDGDTVAGSIVGVVDQDLANVAAVQRCAVRIL